MKRKWLIGIIAYIGLIVICAVVVYVFPSVRGLLTSTYVVEQGELALTDDITGYVIRDEQVYVADRACHVERVAKTGTLYKTGAEAVKFSEGGNAATETENKYKAVMSLLGDSVKKTSDGIANSPGYISFYTDGYEGRLCPENIKDIKMSEYEAINTGLMTGTVKGECTQGDPVFKLTKNSKWYVVFFVDKEEADNYYEGDTVDITIGDVTDKAYVNEVTEGKHVYRIVLKCGFFYKGCLKNRKIEATITTMNARGLLLETKSIVEKDGKRGVLVKDKLGNYTFTPVAIKADDGKTSVAYQDLFMDEKGNFVETIGIYDEIVSRPTKKEIEEAA